MAFTQSNVRRGNKGDEYSIAGSFTSASGDTTLTVTHGMNLVSEASIKLDSSVGWQVPKVTHSAGVATVVWDDTQGGSGSFFFIGK